MDAHEAKEHGLVSNVYNHDSLEEVWNYLTIIPNLSSEVIFLILIYLSYKSIVDIFY